MCRLQWNLVEMEAKNRTWGRFSASDQHHFLDGGFPMKEQFADYQLEEEQTALVFGGGTGGVSAEDFPEDDPPPSI